jgi:hypothetical protein
VITWHPVTGGYTARVALDGICIARLHAYADRWQVESLDPIKAGRANSLPHAKRCALEALAEVLPRLETQVQAALRST